MASDSQIDIEDFAAFDIEKRLPIVRFLETAGSQLVISDDVFAVVWEPLKRAEPFSSEYMIKWLRKRLSNASYRTGAGTPRISGRGRDLSAYTAAYCSIIRWGKWVECCSLLSLDEVERLSFENRRLAEVEARRRFVNNHPLTAKGNVEQLLSDITEKRVELQSFPTYAL